MVFEHFHHAIRRAGAQTRLSGHECAGVDQVKSVYVFGRNDGFEYRVLVDVFGQRQLNQDAVNVGVVIEFLNALQ